MRNITNEDVKDSLGFLFSGLVALIFSIIMGVVGYGISIKETSSTCMCASEFLLWLFCMVFGLMALVLFILAFIAVCAETWNNGPKVEKKESKFKPKFKTGDKIVGNTKGLAEYENCIKGNGYGIVGKVDEDDGDFDVHWYTKDGSKNKCEDAKEEFFDKVTVKKKAAKKKVNK